MVTESIRSLSRGANGLGESSLTTVVGKTWQLTAQQGQPGAITGTLMS